MNLLTISYELMKKSNKSQEKMDLSEGFSLAMLVFLGGIPVLLMFALSIVYFVSKRFLYVLHFPSGEITL